MQLARRTACTIVLVAASLALVACGDDSSDADETAAADGAIVVEQGTIANVGAYRVGVVSVDADNQSAFVSILRADGEKERDAELVVGTPLELPEGTLDLLEATEGGDQRDTIRVHFTAN